MRSTIAAFLLSVQPVFACDLALVLAVDVSGSVDPQEYRIQMDGLAAALRNGIVAEALIDQKAKVTLIQLSSGSILEAVPQKIWNVEIKFQAISVFRDNSAENELNEKGKVQELVKIFETRTDGSTF